MALSLGTSGWATRINAVLKTVPGDADVERRLHQRFASFRSRGEWFRAEPELLSFIEGLAA